ncbi:MAG: hypothetical protein MJ074_02030 [Oscillospiraceae bacterium]|nr:hypothetical protein [Oscillospiraceae bacterium]
MRINGAPEQMLRGTVSSPPGRDKPTVMEIIVPAGVGRGAYINNLSGFKDREYEFLIKRNASLTITSIEEKDEYGELRYYIKMVMDDE